MFHFSQETTRILLQCGWSPTRQIDVSKITAHVRDFVLTSRVHEILSSFGGLSITPLRDGTQLNPPERLEIVPDPLGDAEDWGRSREILLGSPIFPLASWNALVVYIDAQDRVFCEFPYDEVFFVADSFERAMEVFVLGHEKIVPWVCILHNLA